MATIYGDMEGEGTLEARAKAQTLTGVDGEINYIYGDAYLIEGTRGGNDVLTGGASSRFNFLYGDGNQMSASHGGNDVLTVGASSRFNYIYGDAYQMSASHGGNDVLTGGASSQFNDLYGDANEMSASHGGNDVLTGGASSLINYLYGDAYQMSASHGGNDVLTGGASSLINYIYGDAYNMSESHGGNDILIASDNPDTGAFVTNNRLYGDALYHLNGNVICGNDRLVSGTGNDDMWGDVAYSGYTSGPVDLNRVTTGHDIFVFSANNGNDTIHDFRQGEDKIELQGIGVESFDALMAASHLSQGDTNTVITFGSNTITVIGITELSAADFLFT